MSSSERIEGLESVGDMRRGIEVERGKGGREGGEEEDREGRREREWGRREFCLGER